MDMLVNEYYMDRDFSKNETTLYFWQGIELWEKTIEPVAIKTYPYATEPADLYPDIQAHMDERARKLLELLGSEEGREGLTRVVTYLNPMQLKVLKAMEAKIEEEEE